MQDGQQKNKSAKHPISEYGVFESDQVRPEPFITGSSYDDLIDFKCSLSTQNLIYSPRSKINHQNEKLTKKIISVLPFFGVDYLLYTF
jgi:hypothetical protein